MIWEEYKDIYHNFELAVGQSRILTIVASEVLRDYPKGLPKSIKGAASPSQIKKVLEFLLSDPNAEQKIKSKQASIGPDEKDIDQDMFDASLIMSMALIALDRKDEDIDFGRLLIYQEFAMLFAHLDAFMADSIRAICYSCPDVLKRDKKLEWKTVISLGEWNDVVEYMIEQYVLEFTHRSISSRISSLKQGLGLEIEITEIELKTLDKMEKYRNIIVHDGGRISQKFIDDISDLDQRAGEFISISSELLERVLLVSRRLVSKMFIEISRKHYNIQNTEYVWHF